jgi:hypothetical protein
MQLIAGYERGDEEYGVLEVDACARGDTPIGFVSIAQQFTARYGRQAPRQSGIGPRGYHAEEHEYRSERMRFVTNDPGADEIGDLLR